MSAKQQALSVMRPEDVDRFWMKVDKSGECWLWTAAVDPKGYGQFAFHDPSPRRSTTVSAPRVAYYITTGVHPGKKFVCHRCDNPRCVRPDHLFLGDVVDNTADKVAKGRQTKGSAHAGAKLTEEQVEEIRLRYAAGEYQSALAESFNVSQSVISNVVNGKRWAHVGQAPNSPSADYWRGAAALGGLMGMAYAIVNRNKPLPGEDL